METEWGSGGATPCLRNSALASECPVTGRQGKQRRVRGDGSLLLGLFRFACRTLHPRRLRRLDLLEQVLFQQLGQQFVFGIEKGRGVYASPAAARRNRVELFDTLFRLS